ncbi:hypothetical protein ACER0C_004900 [Sarotherodon galilaeus]
MTPRFLTELLEAKVLDAGCQSDSFIQNIHSFVKFLRKLSVAEEAERSEGRLQSFLTLTTQRPDCTDPHCVALITMAMITNNSSKYKNIISKSVLISPGPPAVYQLRPEETKIGTLTRMTVGEKNLNKTNKTILLVGESGAGKSTLINALFNYTIGVKWKDKIWFEIVKKENRSQSESQTSDVIVYEIFGFDAKTAQALPYSLTIIDTPGYGDTRGLEHDDIISNRLLDLFRSEDGVHEVHAVGLVIKANEDRSQHKDYLKDSSQISERGMKEFTVFLKNTPPQKLKITVEVLNDRTRLTACIQNLRERIDLTELKQTEIRQTQKALRRHEEEMKKNEEFTVEVDEVYKEKEAISVCEENCHYPGCTMTWKPEDCEVMKDGCCSSCTRKCPASDHVKEKWRYVTKTRKVKKTVEEMKLKYEKNKTESEKKLSLLENVENEMKQLTAEKSQLLEESYKHVVSLEQIALKADSASTIVHLDFLIEKMKEEGDTEKVQKLEEMRSRVDEETRAALHYLSVCNSGN